VSSSIHQTLVMSPPTYVEDSQFPQVWGTWYSTDRIACPEAHFFFLFWTSGRESLLARMEKKFESN
jgi:hypothetical protein